MLHLIFGSAGTGKSTEITERIRRDVEQGTRAYLIIPEQQANLSERTMLPNLPPRAGLTFTIAGFSRLYDRVAARYGGITVTTPDRPLRMLLLWECLRELSPLLEEYRVPENAAPDRSLTELMLQTMEELQSCDVSAARLEQAAQSLTQNIPLTRKLRDISLLYAAYEARLASVCDNDGGDSVARLAALLKKHRYFEDANIYVDSFTDFTAEEYNVLREMLLASRCVTVALCCDRPNSRIPAFACAVDTARRLRRLANELDIPVSYTYMQENLRTGSEELRRLDRYLWDLSYLHDDDDLPLPAARGDITMLRCSDIYAEAEAAALHILDFLHRGFSYGQMAVIVRDSESYRGVLDAAMERYGIPYYVSDKSSLSEKPLARLILSALRAVSRHFAQSDILTMLKTGLLPVNDADADLFEQYVDTWGITGDDFTAERWVRNPDGYTDRLSSRAEQILQAANHVREVIMTPLLRLYTDIRANPALPALCRALYTYMEDMHLAQSCAAVAQQELSDGHLREAGETVRVYDAVLDALLRLAATLPDVQLTAEEFCSAMTILLSYNELASVPSMHDQVIIGSADTLRVEQIAVGFVLGLCEGDFPRAVSSSGLFSEAEKQQLEQLDVVLDSREERLSSRELMYVWRAMTKPSHALLVSTYTSAMDGTQKSPGIAYSRLLYLFPYLQEQTRTFDLSLLRACQAPTSTEPSDTPTQEEPVAPSPDPEGGTTEYASKAPDASDLSPQVAKSLLGDTLYLTQSRIQTFVQCPFRFYCTYILNIRERKVATIDYADEGTFFHELLEKTLRSCMREDGSFVLPAPQEVDALTHRLVNEYLRTLLLHVDMDAPRAARMLHTFSRLRAMALVLLRDVFGELEHSKFLPVALEYRIGNQKNVSAAPYQIELTDGSCILIGGTVDRVDAYTDRQNRLYLRVIDYKSGSKTFSLSDIRQGVNLQLFIYLFALCRASADQKTPPLPAGAVYLSVKEEKGTVQAKRSGLLLGDEAVLHAMNDQDDPHYLAGIRKGKDGTPGGAALTAAEEFDRLERDIRATLRAIGNDMRAGRASKSSCEEHCRFCPLKDHCTGAKT